MPADRAPDEDAPVAPPVVTMPGEIDMSNVGELVERISEAEALGPDLVIDLSETTFIDSTAISALVGASQRAGERGGRVTVRTEQRMMRRVFRLMNLDVVLVFEPPLDEADELPPGPR